jgi:preprotein translocase subunit YajC
MVAIFAIFYFLLIAPQRKRQKKHQEMLAALKKGDEVVTSGGIHGTVAAVDDRVVHLKIADQVKIKIDRGSVAGFVADGEVSKES